MVSDLPEEIKSYEFAKKFLAYRPDLIDSAQARIMVFWRGPKGADEWLSSHDVFLASAMVFGPTEFEPEPRVVLTIVDTDSPCKTSEEWAKSIDVLVVDPDGWDRSNWQFSWFEQRITLNEFHRRVNNSTTLLPRDYNA